MVRKRVTAAVLAAAGLCLLAAAPSQAAFPGDNGRIAFVSGVENPDIFTMRPYGSDRRNLTQNPAVDIDPSWSPDGRWISFSSDRDGDFEIFVMRADGSDVTQVTHNAVEDFLSSFSPDGEKLTLTRELPDQPGDIWIVDVDGTDERNLTDSPDADDFESAWSPDGRRIAFDSDLSEPENIDVHVIRLSSGDIRRLTDDPAFDGGPDWSPDGRKIAFDTERDGDSEVFVMRRNGDDQTQLTSNDAQDILTGWSPDGEEIAFESHRDGGLVPDPPPDEPDLRFSDVFTMDADGDDQRNVTNTATEFDSDPNWGPQPGDDEEDDEDDEEDED